MSVDIKSELILFAKRMSSSHLSQGKSGNLSVRDTLEGQQGFWITPSGVPYETLTPEALVFVVTATSHYIGRYKPSSEWQMHQDIYNAFNAAESIVHTHSDYATSLACVGKSIPAFHYMVAIAGGDDIPCAPYATFGTRTLSQNVVAALSARKACLMANHGVIAYGSHIKDAYLIAETIETLAKQYIQACQIGTPNILSPDEMAIIVEKFKTYGTAATAETY